MTLDHARLALLALVIAAAALIGCPSDVPTDDDDSADDDAADDDAGDDDAGDDDAGDDDAGDDDADPLAGATSIGSLSVDCALPYLLDGGRLGDQAYLMQHMDALLQQYCITGTVDGTDIAADPMVMAYGLHYPSDPVVAVAQTAMANVSTPTYGVEIDLMPDSAITEGSVWDAGILENQAMALVMEFLDASSACVFGIGRGPSLTTTNVSNVTAVEGGSLTIAGSIDVVDPTEVEGLCGDLAAAGVPCC